LKPAADIGWVDKGEPGPANVRQAATLSNPYVIHNREWGGHVYVCTGPRRPWASYGRRCGTTADVTRFWRDDRSSSVHGQIH
ncbi:MAG: hypothetical protein WBH47_06225, partial [Streptosporangiaceae bacterium]